MADLERRPDESEDDYRARQKRAEVREILDLCPGGLEEFLVSPHWRTNDNGNLVFDHGRCTIFRSRFGGKFTYVIGGGKPAYGDESDIHKTHEETQRALWAAMHRLLE